MGENDTDAYGGRAGPIMLIPELYKSDPNEPGSSQDWSTTPTQTEDVDTTVFPGLATLEICRLLGQASLTPPALGPTTGDTPTIINDTLHCCELRPSFGPHLAPPPSWVPRGETPTLLQPTGESPTLPVLASQWSPIRSMPVVTKKFYSPKWPMLHDPDALANRLWSPKASSPSSAAMASTPPCKRKFVDSP